MSKPVQRHVAHHNVTLLKVDDAVTLDALIARPEIRALIWSRLDGTRAVVDSTRLRLLTQRLRAAGHPARFVEADS